MAAVGVTVAAVYAVLAAASYLLIASFLRGLTRTELLTTAALVVGLALAFGHLSYRCGTARMLARALRTIERASHPVGGLLATLYIHAEESDPLSRMLSTHPPMDERVERLVDMAERRERGEGVTVPVQ